MKFFVLLSLGVSLIIGHAQAQVSQSDFSALERRVDRLEVETDRLKRGEFQSVTSESKVELGCLDVQKKRHRGSVEFGHLMTWLKLCRTTPLDFNRCITESSSFDQACVDKTDDLMMGRRSPDENQKLIKACKQYRLVCRL